jgi:hypothetical protein
MSMEQIQTERVLEKGYLKETLCVRAPTYYLDGFT